MENEINNNTNGEFIVVPDQPTTEDVSDIATENPAKEKKPVLPEKPLGYWEYIGLIILFLVPIVGFIAAIVFMFSPKRKGLKNFARAVVTYLIANFLVTLLIVTLIISAIGNAFVPTINQELGTQFESITEIFDVARAIANGDYSMVIEYFKPQLLEALGEEYEALLNELTNQDYNQMIGQLLNEEYEPLLEDLRSGQYVSLEAVLGEEEFDSFVGEVEIAASGEISELLGGLSGLIPPEISNFLK